MRYGIFLLVVLCLTPVWGEKVADLPELSKPASIAVSGSTLYICDSDVILVYSLDPEIRLLRGIAPFSNEYVIRNDTFTYLVLNEDSMLYELHTHPIDG